MPKPNNTTSALTAWLGQWVQARIDRPLGARHPHRGFIYPLNYGDVPGTVGGDGEPVDVYVLGVSEPVATFGGLCVAVIHRLNDEDDKLVLALPGQAYTADQIRALTAFQERFFHSQLSLASEV